MEIAHKCVSFLISYPIAPKRCGAESWLACVPIKILCEGQTIMDFGKFTEKAQEALAGSQHLASKLNHPQIDVEHLLLATLDQEQGLAPALLSKAGVSVEALKLQIHRELDKR